MSPVNFVIMRGQSANLMGGGGTYHPKGDRCT